MAELDKIKVNGELYDISDSKARSDIASEITNRTNADNALQEKINTNKTGIDNLVNDVAVRNVKAEEVTNVPEVKLPLDEVKEEIEAAGNRVLNSIPDDYTQMNNKISELKGDLGHLVTSYDSIEYSDNRYTSEGLELGKYIKTDGTVEEYEGWSLSGYLPITPNTSYYMMRNLTTYVTNVYHCFYDLNFKYISGAINSKANPLIIAPENAYFVRLSITSSYFNENTMLVESSLFDGVSMEYIPFYRKVKDSYDEIKIRLVESTVKNFPVNYDKAIRSISRLGYDVYNSKTPPQQSIESYKEAYRQGFRIMLCDLRFTSDNVPVLCHDASINSYAKNANGTDISENINIADTSYSDLLQYDYGIYKGSQYAGTKILTLSQMLELCKKLGCECYIEIKSMDTSNNTQAKISCDLVKQYGMKNLVSWSGTFSQMQLIIAEYDTARVSMMPVDNQTIDVSYINAYLDNLRTGKNEVFLFSDSSNAITQDVCDRLISDGIQYEVGTLDTIEEVETFFSQGEQYYYCTGIESNKIVVGKSILENTLLN